MSRLQGQGHKVKGHEVKFTMSWKRLSVDAPPASQHPHQSFSPKVLLPWKMVIVYAWDHISWFQACAYVMKLWLTGNSDCAPNTHLTPQEITFFNLVTLTFDLWPWISKLAKILSGHISIPKIVFIRRTVQSWECWKTDRKTGPILLPRPLTREVKILFSTWLLL